ncbi:MAG: hypothetical protein H7263_01490 [Candidatus Sericytochromatia bacterium]|nr:hypothetical protein [Candidatus Sericytochromatia bacterium]
MEISPLVGSVSTGYGAKEPEMSYAETTQGLKAASKDFTAVLFSYMFSTMRGNPDESGGNEEDGGGGSLFSGENVNMFMGFLDQEVGKKFADQGGKDMVDALYRQLKGNNIFKDEIEAKKKSLEGSENGKDKISMTIQKNKELNLPIKEGQEVKPLPKIVNK